MKKVSENVRIRNCCAHTAYCTYRVDLMYSDSFFVIKLLFKRGSSVPYESYKIHQTLLSSNFLFFHKYQHDMQSKVLKYFFFPFSLELLFIAKIYRRVTVHLQIPATLSGSDLKGFLAPDCIPYFSGSFSSHIAAICESIIHFIRPEYWVSQGLYRLSLSNLLEEVKSTSSAFSGLKSGRFLSFYTKNSHHQNHSRRYFESNWCLTQMLLCGAHCYSFLCNLALKQQI